MSAMPDEIRDRLGRLPNAWMATGYLWSWLVIQPAGQTLALSLPQGWRDYFDEPSTLTKVEQATFALMVANQTDVLLAQYGQVELSVDYSPVMSQALTEAARSANLDHQRLNWPAKTRTVTSNKEIQLCWGDGCHLYRGTIWNLAEALNRHQEDEERPPE